jgi:hypothetical protein
VAEGQKSAESLEGRHSMSPRDQGGIVHVQCGAKFVEMPICGVVSYGF